MKKLVLSLTLFILGLPVLAYAPQWSEICPSDYLNATTKHNPASYILRMTRENNKEADYWANRKIEFDRQVESVSQLPKEQQENYYNQIRMIEMNKNNAHYQGQQSRIARQGLLLQGFNTIQTMWTNSELHGINSGVNGLNNSLNGIRYGY